MIYLQPDFFNEQAHKDKIRKEAIDRCKSVADLIMPSVFFAKRNKTCHLYCSISGYPVNVAYFDHLSMGRGLVYRYGTSGKSGIKDLIGCYLLFCCLASWLRKEIIRERQYATQGFWKVIKISF